MYKIFLLCSTLSIIASSHETASPLLPFEQLPIDLQKLTVLQCVNNNDILQSIKNIKAFALVNKMFNNLIIHDEKFNELIFSSLKKNIQSALLFKTSIMRTVAIKYLTNNENNLKNDIAQSNFLVTHVLVKLKKSYIEALNLVHTPYALQNLKELNKEQLGNMHP